MDFYMQAAHSPSSSSRVKGEGAASLHTTAYRIGPHRVMLHDASCRITFLASGEHLITITPKQRATTYCLRSHASFASAHLGLPMGVAADEVRFVVNNYLMMLYAFAAAPHGLLLFHASAIVHQGKAYLFLGKSGTGKSTHIDCG